MLHHIADVLLAYGPLGVFLLALLDSFGVPLPAAIDALLLLVAWKTPDHAWVTAGLAVAGSLVGNIALFLAARGGGRRWVNSIQNDTPGKPRRFRDWFRRYGLITIFIPALFPIPLPLKVFVISAGVLHTPFAKFLGAVLLARAVRYFGIAYLGIQLGEGAQRFLQHNAFTIAGVAVGFALALYILLRIAGARRDATIL